jgi:hypothetical protein
VHPLRIALFATACLTQLAHAQVIPGPVHRLRDQWVFGGSLFGGFPVGDFRNHEDGGGGGEIMVGFQPFRREPLAIRGTVGSLVYGTVDGYGYQDVCDAFSCWTEEVRYNARNHVMTFLQAGPELMATDGRWRPYVYALAGITFFNSWANLKPSGPNGPGESTQSLFSSHNFSTAYGAGVRRVSSPFGRAGGWEIAVRMTRNAKARYLTEDGLYRNSDGTWNISPRSGAANVVGVHFGFWIGPRRNWDER